MIHFLWAKGFSINEIYLEMHPVYGDNIVLLDQQYMFAVRSLFRVEKVLLRRNDMTALF